MSAEPTSQFQITLDPLNQKAYWRDPRSGVLLNIPFVGLANVLMGRSVTGRSGNLSAESTRWLVESRAHRFGVHPDGWLVEQFRCPPMRTQLPVIKDSIYREDNSYGRHPERQALSKRGFEYMLGQRVIEDPGVEFRHYLVNTQLPPRIWTLFRDMNGNICDVKIHIGTFKGLKHWRFGNVYTGDGRICWGSGAPVFQAKQFSPEQLDIYFLTKTPFNLDWQDPHFLWSMIWRWKLKDGAIVGSMINEKQAKARLQNWERGNRG